MVSSQRHLLTLFPTTVFASVVLAQASLNFALPERTRLLEDQRIDIVEARNITAATSLPVTANVRANTNGLN